MSVRADVRYEASEPPSRWVEVRLTVRPSPQFFMRTGARDPEARLVAIDQQAEIPYVAAESACMSGVAFQLGQLGDRRWHVEFVFIAGVVARMETDAFAYAAAAAVAAAVGSADKAVALAGWHVSELVVSDAGR